MPAAIDGIDPRKFCIEKKVLGVGWRVGTSNPLNKDAYYDSGKKIYGDLSWSRAINAVFLQDGNW